MAATRRPRSAAHSKTASPARTLPAYEAPAAFLSPNKPTALIVVGCGGTGGYVAQGLARLLFERKRRGEPSTLLMLVDGDIVEPDNVGRQLFAPSEVGRNKAVTMATRLATVYGLPITGVPQMADASLLRTLSSSAPNHVKVVLSCVDNAEARRAIAVMMNNWWVTIDCGNDEHSGQVVVGTTNDPLRLRGSLVLGSVATELPSPYLVYKNLLDDPATPVPLGEDCAVAVADNRQGLNVNQWVADVAVQYVTALLQDRRLTSFRTELDLKGMSMRSWPITPSAIASSTGLSVDLFTTPRPPGSAPAVPPGLFLDDDDDEE